MLNEPKISASVMCADQFNLARDLDELQRCGADYLHLDIMDGVFVNNITLGVDVCGAIKQRYDLPVDIHLLVNDPMPLLERLHFGEGDIVGIHAECVADARVIAAMVHGRGARFALILNPSTMIEQVADLLDCVDVVSLMMVEPGFAGLSLQPSIFKKIEEARRYLDDHGFDGVSLEVDGNVSFEYAPEMRRKGADIFVTGSSSLFAPDRTIEEAMDLLRKSLNEGSCPR